MFKASFSVFREAFSEWVSDKAQTMGAALAYYSVFSLAPMLLIAIAVAGLFFGESAAQGQLNRQLAENVGEPAAQAIEKLIANARIARSSGIATAIGIVILFFGASGFFVQLQDSLNTIWKVPPRPGLGIMRVVRDRFLTFLMILGIGILLLASMILTTMLSALGRMSTLGLHGYGPWEAANSLVSFVMGTVLFAIIFKILPDASVRWRDVLIGAVLTSFLFLLGKLLLGFYLAKGGAISAYGAAGSLVAILLWVYYSAQIVLFGAEFTRACARRWTPT